LQEERLVVRFVPGSYKVGREHLAKAAGNRKYAGDLDAALLFGVVDLAIRIPLRHFPPLIMFMPFYRDSETLEH
jgi:hypothetical protein